MRTTKKFKAYYHPNVDELVIYKLTKTGDRMIGYMEIPMTILPDLIKLKAENEEGVTWKHKC